MHMSRASPTSPRTARASPRSVSLRRPRIAEAGAGARPAGLTAWRVGGAGGEVVGRETMVRGLVAGMAGPGVGDRGPAGTGCISPRRVVGNGRAVLIQADHLLPTKVLPDCLQTVNIGLNA